MKKILSIFMVLLTMLLVSSCENTEPPESTEWEPEGIWLGSPLHDYDPHLENIDIELSFLNGEVDPTQKYTSIHIANKKGLPFDVCTIVYLEKRGPIEYYEHPYYSGFWVRVPYNPYDARFNYNTANQHEDQDQTVISFYWSAIQKGYEITPGLYRFVVFVENEPHYINFELK